MDNTLKFQSAPFYIALQPPTGPGLSHYWGFTITPRHTTLGTISLDELSARRRYLYLTTHNAHKSQTSIHALRGIRISNPVKRENAEWCHKPRGHCDGLQSALHSLIPQILQQRHHTRRYSPKYFHDNRVIYVGQRTPPPAVEHELHNETMSIYAEITFWQSCLRNCLLQPCNSQTNLPVLQLAQCEIIRALKDLISRTENIYIVAQGANLAVHWSQ